MLPLSLWGGDDRPLPPPFGSVHSRKKEKTFGRDN